ncbi:MAG: hypothetical protein R2867_01505 [Caldilineaceae bacterium]
MARLPLNLWRPLQRSLVFPIPRTAADLAPTAEELNATYLPLVNR